MQILPILATDVQTLYGPFESTSRPGVKHYVMEFQNAVRKCTCEGYKYRNHCKHIDMVTPEEDQQEFEVVLEADESETVTAITKAEAALAAWHDPDEMFDGLT